MLSNAASIIKIYTLLIERNVTHAGLMSEKINIFATHNESQILSFKSTGSGVLILVSVPIPAVLQVLVQNDQI